jgi:hypothetical protein
MKTIIIAAAVALLAIGAASAGQPRSKSGHYSGTTVYVPSYSVTYGKTFSGGIYYAGKSHNHWSYQCYWSKYGCNCYWCPSTCCYYYWYEPAGCYYPISYITVKTPVYVSISATYGSPPAGIPGLPN